MLDAERLNMSRRCDAISEATFWSSVHTVTFMIHEIKKVCHQPLSQEQIAEWHRVTLEFLKLWHFLREWTESYSNDAEEGNQQMVRNYLYLKV
jgi:hypothetical protein